ncbi:hypothetical protein HD600_000661 [Microbacterium ginsengiterrae]|uniref:Uncharacterized protein n=1 Tax=Microbacterium ginsengiterrae TaxID=546115 RepID=A0A7W9CAQ6_9MICO|nr:hypothetical protein [Microbacterium ginsengiterrae]MBB5742164.1 hypothetical protein [Microbacterium ginsengiterrae]
MSSRDPRSPRPAGVSAVLATVMTAVGFFALSLFGLGALSVATDSDIISTPGLGQAPGIAGMIVAVAVYAGILSLALRVAEPRFRSVWTIAVGTALAHLLAVGITVLFETGEVVTPLAVMGGLITGGAEVVILVAAAIAGWAGVALRRTRASQPRWPWERDEPDAE